MNCHCGNSMLPLGDTSTYADGTHHTPTACLRDYFIAPDAHGEPTLWRRWLDQHDPTPLTRRCEVAPMTWALLERHPEVDAEQSRPAFGSVADLALRKEGA